MNEDKEIERCSQTIDLEDYIDGLDSDDNIQKRKNGKNKGKSKSVWNSSQSFQRQN